MKRKSLLSPVHLRLMKSYASIAFSIASTCIFASGNLYGQPIEGLKDRPSPSFPKTFPMYGGDPFTKVTTGDVVNNGGSSVGNSWIDYDNDGDIDLYVCNYGHNNFCYANNGDGTFTRITAIHIIHPGNSNAGNWGDYDNDGNPDLVVANDGEYEDMEGQFRNNGDGSFIQIVTGEIANDGGSSQGISWADYDNDGYVDLYIPNGFSAPQNNSLFHNNGDGTFTKIVTGAIVTDGGTSLASGWGDYDNDGDQDLFVANAEDENNFFYVNNGDGTFLRDTTITVAIDGGWSFGCSWADFDNDGDLDLFVANISGENDFLYRNNGDGSFTRDTSSIVGNDGATTSGSSWGDYDNDGFLDLFVTHPLGGNNYLYHNNGDGTFTKEETSIVANDAGVSQSCSWADYDNDGDLDLFVANSTGQNNFLYRNNGNGNSWINIVCTGTSSNQSAIGARVTARATINGTPVWQRRDIEGQSGYRSENSLNVEFGFGTATVIDTILVYWPSGARDTLANVSVNQFITIAESGVVLSAGDGNNRVPTAFVLNQNYPNPFNPSTTIRYSIPSDTHVTLVVYDILGQQVAILVDGDERAGIHEVRFIPKGQSSGLYFYRLEAGGHSETRKFMVVR